MDTGAKQGRGSPLAGTERAFFEGRKDALRTEYEAGIQGMVAAWEASSDALAALAKKRFRPVRFVTFFGTVVLRCREGVGRDGRWVCPVLAHLGLRPNQRYSPDMERRLAVLATETLSYQKASAAGDEAAWITFSDGAVHAAADAGLKWLFFGRSERSFFLSSPAI